MPHYLFETPPITAADRTSALRLVAERFPEVEVEHRFSPHDEPEDREVWVCRAPSADHVRRWASTAELPLAHLRRVVLDLPRSSSAPVR